MRKRTVFITLLSVLLLGSMVTSCHKDNETPLYKELNEFIWVGLYNYYLWVDDVPELSTANYSSENALYSFWYKNTDSEAFFYSLLYQYGTVDRFSWIVDNYEELEASFQGVTKSTGAVFGRSLLRNGNIAAVVLYTVKGAPADKAGIKRGDIFYKVNDVILTTSNYSELYSATNYSLSYATVTDSVAIPTGKIANLVAEEVHENPIYLDTVYTIQNKKIGYLVYNGFMSDYDLALNNVFASFKTQKIDELILDLRYNLGGSGQTATYLASMIYATDTTAIFYKTQCNKLFGAYILETEGADALNSYFADAIVDTESSSSTPINSLNLQNLYIIATGSTASASELIINGLKPYVNVTIVGSTTVGKNVGSMTIKDYDENGVLNTRHKWAMQPIIFKVANKNGVSDYSNGIAPDIYARETRDNIKPLGDITEILLQTSLNRILGISQTSVKSIPMGRSMILSKEYAQFATELYFDSKKYGISNFKKSRN